MRRVLRVAVAIVLAACHSSTGTGSPNTSATQPQVIAPTSAAAPAVRSATAARTALAVAPGHVENGDDFFSEGRTEHTGVWTGTEFIVWGGDDAVPSEENDYQPVQPHPLSNGARYNPLHNSWARVSDAGAPSARYDHTAVWSTNEMIVWGGSTAARQTTNTGARYNPTTNVWTAMSTRGAPAARARHTAVWTGVEMIVFGGSNGARELGDGAAYNPATDSWRSIANAPNPRANHVVAWTGDAMIVWGGRVLSHVLSTGAVYNVGANRWQALSNEHALASREFASAAWTGSELIVLGGTNGRRRFPSGGRIQPAGTWQAIAGSPSVSVSCVVWTGTRLIAGSSAESDSEDSTESADPQFGEFDPATSTWPLGAVGSIANGARCVWTGDVFLSFGGFDGSNLDGMLTVYRPLASANAGGASPQPPTQTESSPRS